MSAPGKDLVFALLMQDLKCWGVRMKSIWLWTCPLGAYQVAVLDNLWGWRMLARVSWWLFANSQSPSSVICLSNAKPSNCPYPVLVCVRAYFSIPVTLNYKYILLGSLCFDAIKLLIQLFVVWRWCVDLNDCDVVWSYQDPDWDESARNGSAADDTIYNFFLYNECHPILAFQVFSVIPDLVSHICGSFSKPCQSDLRTAQDVQLSVLTHGWAPVLFRGHVESRILIKTISCH